MSDYTVTTDFSVKDGLTSGDPNKKIVGSDFDVEFDAIAVAIATKPNEVASPVANNLIKQDANGHNIDADSISDNGSVVAIATGRTLNVVDNGGLYIAGTSVTSTAAELNILDGCTATATELNLLSGKTGTVWTSTNDGAASGLDADLLDGQHGSYYTNGSNINAGTVANTYLPSASDTAAGIAERATAAECNALSDTTRFVTPGRIPTSSATQQGVVELATNAEVATGTDTARAVTPAGLQNKLTAEADITQGGLNTSTTSLAGTVGAGSQATIVLTAYCFFPMVHTQDSLRMMGDATDAASADLPRFDLFNTDGSVSKTYDVDYRYIIS